MDLSNSRSLLYYQYIYKQRLYYKREKKTKKWGGGGGGGGDRGEKGGQLGNRKRGGDKW